MNEKFAKGLDAKQIIAQNQERKRLDLLEGLKKLNGPFTHADDVQSYLDNSKIFLPFLSQYTMFTNR